MVHGLPGSVRDYRWLESALRETPQGSLANLRVVRLDMPGLGGTDLRLADAHDVTSRARFVLEALDALGLERVVLVGHSMGGGVTLTAAALSRKRAGCAVVGVCQVASVGNRPHKAYLRMPNRSSSASSADGGRSRVDRDTFRFLLEPQTAARKLSHQSRSVAEVEVLGPHAR
jgi:pimeloyl-ACP methyl ester carboxylesterase